MNKEEREKITDLNKCDFKAMHAYFLEQSEKRKAMTKEEKNKIKESKEAEVNTRVLYLSPNQQAFSKKNTGSHSLTATSRRWATSASSLRACSVAAVSTRRWAS